MVLEKDFAILLGNGINNYKNNGKISWKNLLLGLCNINLEKKYINYGNVSYPEFYDLLCFNSSDDSSRYKNLKPRIVSEVKKMRNSEDNAPFLTHDNFISFARKNNIPVLTTNYDTTLLNSSLLNANKKITKQSGKKKFAPIKNTDKFTDWYPWHSYYSDRKIKDCCAEFGIWHVHGFWYYKRSLAIGASDYAANISRLRKWIYEDKASLYKAARSNYNQWIGSGSWVDIFFHKNLYIIGLKLESQETSLRWLFMEREKYYRKFPKKRKETFYITTEEMKNDTKNFYFEALKIEIKIANDYDEIYSNWKIK